MSAEAEHRDDVVRMCQWAADWVVRLGGTAELRDIGEQSPGLRLPPVVLGAIPAVPDPSKKTVCVYGHLDVQPAKKVCHLPGWGQPSHCVSDLFVTVASSSWRHPRQCSVPGVSVHAWRVIRRHVPVPCVDPRKGLAWGGSPGILFHYRS